MTKEFHPIYKDATEELEQIEKILNDKTKRKFSEIQFGILLRKRIAAFITYMNSSNSENIPVEEQSEFLQFILEKIKNILTFKPKDESELFWYQLESLRLNFVANLMAAWGKAGLLRVIGTAHALENILLGIDLINVKEIFVEREHSEYSSRNSLAIDLVNFSASLYYIASATLYSIPKETLKDWVFKALSENQKIFGIIEKVWDIPFQYNLDKKLGENRVFTLISVIINIFNSMIHYLLLLQGRFKTWPQLNNQITFLNASSQESYLSSIEKIVEKRDSYINEIYLRIKEGTFDQNDSPINQPGIQEALLNAMLYGYVVKGFRLIFEIVSKKNTLMIDELGKFLFEMKEFLNGIPKLLEPTFLRSSFAEILAVNLEYYLLFLSVYSDAKKDLSLFNENELTFKIYFSNEGTERFPQIYGLFLLSKLFVMASIEDTTQMYEVANEISTNALKYTFQPRDSFAMLLLGELTKLILGKTELGVFEKIIKEKLNEIEPFSETGYIQAINMYLENLLAIFNKTSPIKRFAREIPFSFSDPYSFLIPNLGKIAIKNNLGEVAYIPYNLATDYIIKL